MKPFTYPFRTEGQRAVLKMKAPVADTRGAHREGSIVLDNGREMPILCRHSDAAAALTYLRPLEVNDDWRRLVGIPVAGFTQVINAPGSLHMGVSRSRILTQGILDIFASQDLIRTLKNALEEKVAVLPVLREGKQFGLASHLQSECGLTCAEVPVEKAVDGSEGNFQSPDGILTGAQRERIQVGVVGTGFSQGPELIRLINFLQTKFVNLSHIELIIPSATLQGLVQALAKTSPGISLRTHVFETLLDSRDGGGTFFSHPEFHLRPVLSQRYRAWWGRDWSGRPIANMPHIGTDNADALFDPLRQIRTLNARLEKSHQTNLAQVLARHLSLAPVKG